MTRKVVRVNKIVGEQWHDPKFGFLPTGDFVQLVICLCSGVKMLKGNTGLWHCTIWLKNATEIF